MKKLMVFLLVFAVVFTFTACSPKENKTGTEDQNTTSAGNEEETKDPVTKDENATDPSGSGSGSGNDSGSGSGSGSGNDSGSGSGSGSGNDSGSGSGSTLPIIPDGEVIVTPIIPF